MIKIWAKIITDNKIVKSFVFTKDENIVYSHFFDYVTEICYNLDIPTPVLIKTNVFNYAKFNFVKFVKDDFVENVNFDKLVLENILK